ncbi:NAD(P)/FAD-dependent oxidoreductase [Ktedonospora formicarum]|uniref:Halogenase n=1 Tax=Ktedonospora formicarum TaxID=2778364 RepID=A0A8J3I110_9CHLR|nr:tryptophan 7-halogenase [Ktedonospora formicarum]GHO48032.1 halogenase [Ktedonospora formicarum]
MSDVYERIAALPAEKRALLQQQLRNRKTQNTAHATQDENHTPDQYDVAILGGGISGLTLALELKKNRPSMRILVIDKQKHPVPEAAHKVGESSVEIAAHYLRDILGLKEHLETQQIRKFGLRMFFTNADNKDITRRVELGSTEFPPLATYQIDRGRLENMLGKLLPEQGVNFLDGVKVQQIMLRPEQDTHCITVNQGGQERQISARWVVDASGRSALLQRQLGLAKKWGHAANSAWFRVKHPIDINTWSDDPAWHSRIPKGDRSLSTNHLMGPGYWVWIIRLASGSTSVGIVADANVHPFEGFNLFERAMAWLHEREPQLAQLIEEHRDEVQDFRVMRDYSYGCQQLYSGERWCLTGEAAVSLDPLYSPGSDMIAISNGLICDLITRDMKGEDIQSRAAINDRLFLNLASIWINIYEKQYSLMDKAQVMVSKIIWDTAFYWGVFGLLYFHHAFRDIAESPGIATNLAKIAQLSNRVQAFYREWHSIADKEAADTFVDLYSPINFMVKLHAGMDAKLSPSELDAQFAANVRLFEQLAGQLMSTVIQTYASRAGDEAVLKQIQRWQTEPYLAELIATYRRENRVNPTSTGWMMLDQGVREKVEAIR